MSIQLPEAFVDRIHRQLQSELPAFLCAMDEAPFRGIRLNPMKPSNARERFRLEAPVPWTDGAYYLDGDSTAGATALHETGAFYIQDPCAMLPASVLDPLPGQKVLDLCAAPGGKATQIGCAMKGEGLLVCNEPVYARACVLSRNVERIGLPNTVVTCSTPEKLAGAWAGGFDAVLADVPCSGEGMFRKDPASRLEWTPERAEGCVLRQRPIMASAAELVRAGGRFVYSTCTFNPAENEDNVRWFLEHFPLFEPEPFSLPGVHAPEAMYTCYPQRMKGEGQFVARFRKKGGESAFLPDDRSLAKPAAEETRVMSELFPYFPPPTHRFGSTLVRLPECPELKGIRTLRVGIHLGEVRGKNSVPDHAAAMCFSLTDGQRLPLDADRIVRYMAGETFECEASGWTILCYGGLAAGWGKASGGIMKNHYPKGLRTQHILP